MRTYKFATVLTALTVIACIGQASAAVVATYSGVQTNLFAWRTSSVEKPLDGDGDNVIGTLGYHLFGAAGENGSRVNKSNGPLADLPSYLSVTNNTGGEVSYNYAIIDNPVDNDPEDIVSGTADGNTGSKKIATITFASGVPSALTLSLMNDNLDNTSFNATTAYQIRASNDTDVLATVPLVVGNKQPDWHFISLTGLADGDSIQVWNEAGRASLGGIAFDVPTPVPPQGTVIIIQ